MKASSGAALIAAALLVTSCDGGDQKQAATPTSPSSAAAAGTTTSGSSGGPAATAAAITSTTAARPLGPAGPVPEAKLKTALLAVGDIPPGFAEMAPEPAESASGGTGVCGKPTVASRVPSKAAAMIRFSKGSMTGPFLQERLSSFATSADAARYVATARADAASCKSWKDAEGAETSVAPLNVGAHGEETLAYRTTGGGATADIVYVRLGAAVVQVTHVGFGIDADLTLSLVPKAVAKAGQLA